MAEAAYMLETANKKENTTMKIDTTKDDRIRQYVEALRVLVRLRDELPADFEGASDGPTTEELWSYIEAAPAPEWHTDPKVIGVKDGYGRVWVRAAHDRDGWCLNHNKALSHGWWSIESVYSIARWEDVSFTSGGDGA